MEDRGNSNALKVFQVIRDNSQMTDAARARVESRMEAAGFLHASRMGSIPGNATIINALVERWRPETNTFHIPCGEDTITLEDVHMLSGLPVNGFAVTGHPCLDKQQLIEDYLIAIPPSNRETVGRTIKMSWLAQVLLSELPTETSSEDFVDRWTRSLLLMFIGGTLLADKSDNKVHLQYLQLLVDFRQAGRYAWGAAVLAYIYRSLTKSSKPGVLQMSGCTDIIYAWFWLRFPSLAPTPTEHPPDIPSFPLIAR